MLHIGAILTDETCRAIADATKAPALWRDGIGTAQGEARAVKNNVQGDIASSAVKGAIATIEAALARHPVVTAAAQPDQFIRLTLNRYEPGMAYGDHVDAPYINDMRTDLSFTLFLNEPHDYEGGELVIDSAGHEDAVKGPAGSLVLYPATAVHRVEAVRTGARLACVGWIKSRIRSNEHRALVFELETIIADLRNNDTPRPVYKKLLNVRNNLLRTFGE